MNNQININESDKKLLSDRLFKLRQRRATLLEQIHELNDEVQRILIIIEPTSFEDEMQEQNTESLEDEVRITRTDSSMLADLVLDDQIAVDFYLGRVRRLSSRRMTASAPEFMPSQHILANIEEKELKEAKQMKQSQQLQ